MPRVKTSLLTYANNADPDFVLDANGRLHVVNNNDPVPPGATITRQVASSGNVANGSAVASFAAQVGKTNYITGLIITASGATAALVVDATLTGLAGGTLTFSFAFPAGATVQAQPLVINFPIPIPASAPNIAITLTLPASGAGGAHAAVSISGFVAG